MLRVCGADGEQSKFQQSQCWCKGVFCGRGGAKLTTAFKRAFRKSATASSREQFLDLCGQADLFDGDTQRAAWLARFQGTVRDDARAV